MPDGFSRITNLPGQSNAKPVNSAGAATDSVRQFQNQQLAGLSTGTGSRVGQQGQSPSQQLLGMRSPKTGVALSAQRRTDAVSATNKRLGSLAEAQGAKRRAIEAARQAEIARRQAAQRAQQQGQQYGGAPQGRAYTPDGRLSGSRNRVLQLASGYLGSPYVLGGTTTRGIDCSGLVMMVYNQLGYNITRHSATWQGNNIPGVRTSLRNLRPGDIVAWKDGSHIAIYAGNGQIIESANERVGTVRRNLWAPESAVFGIALRLPGE